MDLIDTARTPLSVQLAQAHDTLRHRLRRLQANLGETPDDSETPGDKGDLLSNCLAFCSALTTHHVGEDGGMFADLLRARPDLEPVITNLVNDHQMIAAILTSAQSLAKEGGVATNERREAIRRELDGLQAILESHFRYEERAVSNALDIGVRDTGWSKPVLELEE